MQNILKLWLFIKEKMGFGVEGSRIYWWCVKVLSPISEGLSIVYMWCHLRKISSTLFQEATWKRCGPFCCISMKQYKWGMKNEMLKNVTHLGFLNGFM
jgi:hypothetical protein